MGDLDVWICIGGKGSKIAILGENDALRFSWWWVCLDLHALYPICRLKHVPGVPSILQINFTFFGAKSEYKMMIFIVKNFHQLTHTYQIMLSHVIKYPIVKI